MKVVFFSLYFLVAISLSIPTQAQTSPPAISFDITIYSATWCGPCQALHRILESAGFGHRMPVSIDGIMREVSIHFVDVTEQGEEERRRLHPGLPDIHLSVNGQLMARIEGGQTITSLSVALAQAFRSFREAENLDPLEMSSALSGFSPRAEGNAILIGTGSHSSNNPIFVGVSLRSIQRILRDSMLLPQASVATLYGAVTRGDQPTEAVAARPAAPGHGYHPEEYLTSVPGVERNREFSRESLRQALRSLRNAQARNTLLIFSGHGSEDGIQLRDDQFRMGARELGRLIRASGTNAVIVSGNCYGGQFATAGQCGFFAARPDTAASGCSMDSNQMNEGHPLTDYSAVWFEGLQSRRADLNHDGIITFEEAHFYAVGNGEERDVPFTTLDALAERYFTSHPSALPTSIGRSDIENLRYIATPVESLLLDFLWNYATMESHNLGSHSLNQFRANESMVRDRRSLPRVNSVVLKTTSFVVALAGLQIPIEANPFKNEWGMYEVRHNVEGLEAGIRQFLPAFVPAAARIHNLFLVARYENEILNLTLGGAFRNLQVGQQEQFYYFMVDRSRPDTQEHFNISALSAPLALPTILRENWGVGAANHNFRTALPQLLRRLLFRRALQQGRAPELMHEYQEISSCESQDVEAFLGARNRRLVPRQISFSRSWLGSVL